MEVYNKYGGLPDTPTKATQALTAEIKELKQKIKDANAKLTFYKEWVDGLMDTGNKPWGGY